MKPSSPLTEKEICEYALIVAEKAVTIPKGGKVGRWTREDRVALVATVVAKLIRNGQKKK